MAIEKNDRTPEIQALIDAAQGVVAFYTHAWDLADGSGLIIPVESMDKFTERFETLHDALAEVNGTPKLIRDFDP